MPGVGKYTKYAPAASDKNLLLSKLFSSSPTAQFVGKENEARQATVAIAKTHLTPAHAEGDASVYPTGVDLTFSGSPSAEDVKWSAPGDPANGYVPDLSSPGPGKTNALDKDVDPNIKASDIKPAYTPGSPGTGTRASSAAAAKLVAANMLGVNLKMGDSGAND